jgi:hypothetical protein
MNTSASRILLQRRLLSFYRLTFRRPQEVDDPNDAKYVSLADLKHWELAPGQSCRI